MNKAYKYRLYPERDQEKLIIKTYDRLFSRDAVLLHANACDADAAINIKNEGCRIPGIS